MPIIADNKLSQAGIVFPSYRHQLAFLDIFDASLPNTNFNWFESGTSGAGKSVLAQTIARQVLDSGVICPSLISVTATRRFARAWVAPTLTGKPCALIRLPTLPISP
ncbi:hypothetical protein [Arsenophonus apicola]|uniref:hypothetical protein n=1 Tax=Arsenophonus apicola TaxID=2879119 RepID=UPI001CDC520A|nr:hypothetical protein [Arsenophonus apicola]UBX30651.1 hypothetical protein LDL57_15955 [Arsenophonus apicola]